MRMLRAAVVFSVVIAVLPASARAAVVRNPGWRMSHGTLPIGKDRAIGLKLDDHRVIWLGGFADNPADDNRAFIYDTRSQTFREIAPTPAAKPLGLVSAAGVLKDGTVVVAGGQISTPDDGTSALSYRYDPSRDRWTRTGDLPEPQEWYFMPTTLLHDGRLLIAGGLGLDGLATGTASRHAFIYDPKARSTVSVIDPQTGTPTGKKAVVAGKWDYTRRANGSETKLSGGHLFGNAALLHDGRVFVGGGHTIWRYPDQPDLSVLATDTQFFDPATGMWSQGAPLPTVPGEDDRISNSHGGRTNGVCFAALPDNKVVIAGGNSQSDGESYFDTEIGRQSILVMTPASNPRNSRYQLSPNPIPPGFDAGGLFGDGGRNQLLCYPVSGGRVVIAGGENTAGDDLYDTYRFDPGNWTVRRGPDMVHGHPHWAAELGYPADYQTGAISTLGVGMRNSKLVFGNDVLVHGGGYDVISVDFDADRALTSRKVEQLSP